MSINKNDIKYIVFLSASIIYKIKNIEIRNCEDMQVITYTIIDETAYDIDGKEIYCTDDIKDNQNISVYENQNLFDTKKDAVEYMKKTYRKWIDKGKKEIVDLKDLLSYPVNHNIFNDILQLTMYKERCKELLNIDIDMEIVGRVMYES